LLQSITDANAKESAAHTARCEAETRLLAPPANHKLIARGLVVIKLTKKEIIAVVAVYYEKQEISKKNKLILAELLKAYIELNGPALLPI
jgi:hypothetical protein